MYMIADLRIKYLARFETDIELDLDVEVRVLNKLSRGVTTSVKIDFTF